MLKGLNGKRTINGAVAFGLSLVMLATANLTAVRADELMVTEAVPADTEELSAETGWSSPLPNTTLTAVKGVAQQISLSTKVNVTITDQDVVPDYDFYARWYSFTPASTGDYHISFSDIPDTEPEVEPDMVIFDEEGRKRGSQYYYDEESDIWLQKDKTYYIMASVGSNEKEEPFQEQNYSFTLTRDTFNLIYAPEIECYAGQPITLSVDVESPAEEGEVSYQWGISDEYDFDDPEDVSIEMLNEHNKDYTFSPEQGEINLVCIVENQKRTKYAKIHVNASYFKLKSKDIYTFYEQPVVISVSGNTLDTDQPISVTWSKKSDNPVLNDQGFYVVQYTDTVSKNTISANSVDGHFSCELPLIAKGYDAYRCLITQGDHSEFVIIYVNGTSFEAQVINILNMEYGETGTFDFHPHMTDGTPDNFTFQWEVFRKDAEGKPIIYDASNEEVIIGGLNQNPLTICPDCPGTFYTSCAITSAAGEKKTYSGNIYVKAPKITVKPVSNKVQFIKKGQSADLQVAVESAWKDLHYQWYQGGNGSEDYKIAGAQTDKYKVTLTKELEEFYCSVNNGLQDAFESDSQKFVLVDTTGAVNLSGNPSVPTALVKDQPKLCHVSKTETYYYASFRPDKSGAYAFCMQGTHSGSIHVSDQNGNMPDTSLDCDAYSVDPLYKGELWLYGLEAGKTYSVRVDLYNDDDSDDPQNISGYVLLTATEAVYKDMKNATVTLSQSSFVYDGKEKRPAVTVKLAGRVLVEGRDYTVTYQNNINVGTATVLIKGLYNSNFYTGSCTKTFTITAPQKDTTQQPPAEGNKELQKDEEVKQDGATYAAADKGELTYKATTSKKSSSIVVKDTVKVNGVTYKVTTIGADAFKGSAAKKITVGKNITTIKNNAFKGDKKLKTLIIRSTKLTKNGISKKAFKGITKKTTIKVPKKKLKAYKKLFRKKGLAKSVKVKAI